MTDIAKGTLVRHASLGVGKVVAVEPTAVHVFFPGTERRHAAKLRWPDARTLLRTDGVERDAWLEGLSSFTLDPAARRYALSASWITHEQALARFRAEYPRGFQDPTYLGTGPDAAGARAPRWRSAGAEWAAAMGDGEAERLLAAGDGRELVRRTLRIEKHLALVPDAFEEGTLKQALADPDAALPFFEAVVGLLGAPPGRARAESLFAAVQALEVEPALAWPVATVLPFVADPARHVLLLPRSTPAAAERLGFDLRFDAVPNWTTYAALRTFSVRLLARLEPEGARDLADVEAFLHAMAATRPPGARRTTARTSRTTASNRRTR
jgi:hypothetical protein